MSFIGTLVLWRGTGQLPGDGASAYEVELFQARGGWTVSYLDAELVGTDAKPLLDSICRSTGAPALTTFVFESDCGLVSASDPGGAFWTTCLVRTVVANLDELDEDEMQRKYGSPEQGVERAQAWAQAAGLTPNAAFLNQVLAFTWGEEIFLGLKLFDALLAGLGLPASAEPNFYE